MTRADIHKQIHFLLLAAIAFCMPLPVKINSVLLMLLGVNWLAEGEFREKLRSIVSNRISLCWMAFYLLHVVSYFISDNKTEAGAILERRLSFVVFPLLMAIPLQPDKVKKICYAFCAGVLMALGVCIGMAISRYSTTPTPTWFFYHELASGIGMNAVYLSAYAAFTIQVLLHYNHEAGIIYKWPGLAAVCFLIVCCLMLSSKIILTILALMLVLRVLQYNHSLRTVKVVALSIGVAFVLIGAIMVIPQTRERFTTELSTDFSVITRNEFRYDTPFTGSSLRLRIWKFCFEILHENRAWVTGVGIGDMQDLLNAKYRQTGMYTGNPELHDTGYLGYGPHNECIEILTVLGIPAALFFSYIFFMLWQRAVTRNHYVLPGILLLISVFFLSESVLSTAKGIIFFMFFTTLFINRRDIDTEKETGF